MIAKERRLIGCDGELVQTEARLPGVEQDELRTAVREEGSDAHVIAGRAILRQPDEAHGDIPPRLQRVLRDEPRIERLLARAGLEDDTPRKGPEELIHISSGMQRKESLPERDVARSLSWCTPR